MHSLIVQSLEFSKLFLEPVHKKKKKETYATRTLSLLFFKVFFRIGQII